MIHGISLVAKAHGKSAMSVGESPAGMGVKAVAMSMLVMVMAMTMLVALVTITVTPLSIICQLIDLGACIVQALLKILTLPTLQAISAHFTFKSFDSVLPIVQSVCFSRRDSAVFDTLLNHSCLFALFFVNSELDRFRGWTAYLMKVFVVVDAIVPNSARIAIVGRGLSRQ